MARPDDAQFVALARKAGFPSEAELRALHAQQQEALKGGERVALFDLAVKTGLLDAEKERGFERWTDLALGTSAAKSQGAKTGTVAIPKVDQPGDAAPAAAPPPTGKTAPLPPPMAPVPPPMAPVPAPLALSPQPAAPAPPAPAPAPPPAAPAAPAEAAAIDPEKKKTGRLGTLSSGKHRATGALGKSRAFRLTTSSASFPAAGSLEAKKASRNGLLLVGGSFLAIGLLAGALVVSSSGPAAPAGETVATAPPPPPAAPPPAVAPPPRPPAVDPKTNEVLDAYTVLADAAKLEADKREADALIELEGALDRLQGTARERVDAAHDLLMGRVHALLDQGCRDIERLILDGKADDAADAANRLRPRLPVTLVGDLDRALEKAKAKAEARAQAEEAKRSSADDEEQAKAELERRAAAAESYARAQREWEKRVEARRAEVKRYMTLAKAVMRGVAAFSPSKAKAALETVPELEDPGLADALAAQGDIVHAFARFADCVRAGLAPSEGKEVAIELRDGQRATVKIAKVRSEEVVLHARDGDQTFAFGDLGTNFLLAAGLRAKGAGDESYYLGAAAWLAFTSQKSAALEALKKGPARGKAVEYVKSILDEVDDDASPGPAEPPPVAGAAAGDSGSGSGQVFDPKNVKVKDEKPLTPGERKAALEAVKKAGNWKVAVSSKYYDFFSNGDLDEVKDLAARMDIMFEAYRKVFSLKSDPKRPFPVWLYKNHREFAEKTQVPEGVAGFYDGEKIVAFHGTYYSLTTERVLFHEGTHQFQGLAFGENLWRASIWFVEGLAVYFEASQIDGRTLTTDQIPRDRLLAVKRAIQSGDFIPLDELIRTDAKSFGGLHYAHAWSLIYFLCYGTNGGLERLKKYYEGLKAGEDGVKLFEKLFNKPMREIEDAWKAYVLSL